MTKPLIAFYSRAGENYGTGGMVDLPVGNTEVVAGMIAEATGGDLLRLETVRPYPDGYRETTDVARRELRERARPELRVRPLDIDGYDVVFVGYPNWWGTAPMAVFTFLESFDFAGKTVVPFCTHEGSGMGVSERDIRAACPGASVLAGLAVRGSRVHDAQNAVREWVASAAPEITSR